MMFVHFFFFLLRLSSESDCADQQEALNKIKEKKKLKASLTDRKSVAAQQRMKSIATLATDNGGKKRKRGEKGKFSLHH